MEEAAGALRHTGCCGTRILNDPLPDNMHDNKNAGIYYWRGL